MCLSVTVEKREPSLKARNESRILFNRNRSFRKKKPNNTMTRKKGLSATQKSWPRGQCGAEWEQGYTPWDFTDGKHRRRLGKSCGQGLRGQITALTQVEQRGTAWASRCPVCRSPIHTGTDSCTNVQLLEVISTSGGERKLRRTQH